MTAPADPPPADDRPVPGAAPMGAGSSEGEEARAADLAIGVARTSWPWIVAGAAAIAFVALMLWGANSPDDPTLPVGDAGGTPTTPADGLNLTEVTRLIGETCHRLLVADTPEERSSGLRYREAELDRVNGMLFVFDEPQATPGFFTMAGVTSGLAVGFYGPDGVRMGEHEMVPCEGTIDGCPKYPAPPGYQYALETKPGDLPAGNLGGECPVSP